MLGQGTQTSPSEHHECPCARLAFVKVQTHDWMLALWWLALPCLAGQTLSSLVLPQVVRPEHVPGGTCCKMVSSAHKGSEHKDSHLGERQIHHPEVHSDLRQLSGDWDRRHLLGHLLGGANRATQGMRCAGLRDLAGSQPVVIEG